MCLENSQHRVSTQKKKTGKLVFIVSGILKVFPKTKASSLASD